MNDICYKKFNSLDVEYTVALNGEGIVNSFEKILKLIFQEFTNSKLLSCKGSYFFQVK